MVVVLVVLDVMVVEDDELVVVVDEVPVDVVVVVDELVLVPVVVLLFELVLVVVPVVVLDAVLELVLVLVGVLVLVLDVVLVLKIVDDDDVVGVDEAVVVDVNDDVAGVMIFCRLVVVQEVSLLDQHSQCLLLLFLDTITGYNSQTCRKAVYSIALQVLSCTHSCIQCAKNVDSRYIFGWSCGRQQPGCPPT